MHSLAGRRRSVACALLAPAAHAGLFDDDEARKAILDLRQKLEQSNEQQRARQAELNAQMARADRPAQAQPARPEQPARDCCAPTTPSCAARTSSCTRDVAELQRQQKDMQQGVDERIRKLEPQKVTVDGREFIADPDEKRQLRRGDGRACAAASSPARRAALVALPEALSGAAATASRRCSGSATRSTASATTRRRSPRFRAWSPARPTARARPRRCWRSPTARPS